MRKRDDKAVDGMEYQVHGRPYFQRNAVDISKHIDTNYSTGNIPKSGKLQIWEFL